MITRSAFWRVVTKVAQYHIEPASYHVLAAHSCAWASKAVFPSLVTGNVIRESAKPTRFRTDMYIVPIVLALAALPFDVAQASEASELAAQLQGLKNEYKQLEVERANLEQKKTNLEWAITQINPKIEQFKADRENLEGVSGNLARKIDAHNGRCGGTFSDEGFVAACNGRKAQLDAEAAHNRELNGNLETTRRLLLEAVQTNTSEITVVAAEDKKKYNRQLEIGAMVRPIISRMLQLAQNDARCKRAINGGSLETMHFECGAMFDGN